MSFPSVDPEEVGATGLGWLLITYGYVLYQASNLIAGGSDLLLLVPSMAGLVGGVVLPLLGAVPDGAIMLFSGMGDIQVAQESLAVGVGALAGSTIMLLTVAWSLCLFAGIVDYGENGEPDYLKKPKLSSNKSFKELLFKTGVDASPKVNRGSKIMMITATSYLLIQVPASYLVHETHDELTKDEFPWALAAFIVCLIGFVAYLYLQFKTSSEGLDIDKETFVMKKAIDDNRVSLRTCIYDYFTVIEKTERFRGNDEYMSISNVELKPQASDVLRALLKVPFEKHDRNHDQHLDKGEIRSIFFELGEKDNKKMAETMFETYDDNNDGKINFDEFVQAAYDMFKKDFNAEKERRAQSLMEPTVENEEEEEEFPEDLLDLDPEAQQKAIKIRAFMMLTFGTTLVVTFSDPMVDVLKEMSKRIGIPSFYVSFVLVPFASNASELLASRFYAAKKTKKSINVSFAALEGAAAMNNTFCLAIFMGLIVFRRGLVWQYTAETAAILSVQIVVGLLALKSNMSFLDGLIIASLYPASLALVAVLENGFGLD